MRGIDKASQHFQLCRHTHYREFMSSECGVSTEPRKYMVTAAQPQFPCEDRICRSTIEILLFRNWIALTGVDKGTFLMDRHQPIWNGFCLWTLVVEPHCVMRSNKRLRCAEYKPRVESRYTPRSLAAEQSMSAILFHGNAGAGRQ